MLYFLRDKLGINYPVTETFLSSSLLRATAFRLEEDEADGARARLRRSTKARLRGFFTYSSSPRRGERVDRGVVGISSSPKALEASFSVVSPGNPSFEVHVRGCLSMNCLEIKRCSARRGSSDSDNGDLDKRTCKERVQIGSHNRHDTREHRHGNHEKENIKGD
ncbi:uncharacterized protein LOC121990870 [Zingiber officinale]|uniref:uncharacterized protein LOC121990870 n=1 Tax=Zingiber officinale TaxID=94328 RepID=UPI001C4B9B8B|nr:uncharacterized protein LOC121990870 [Zingiber officinale]